MKFDELRILTDKNISPKVVTFLRKHNIDVLDTKEQGWYGKSDDELLDIAYQDNRWIITHDTDFGTLTIHEGKRYIGIIFLRVRNMNSQNIIRVCSQLLDHDIDLLYGALVVVEETRIRIRHKEHD